MMSDYEQKRTNWLLEKQIKLIESMMEQMGLQIPEQQPLKYHWGGPK